MKKENPKDKISRLPLTYFSNHEIRTEQESMLRKLLLNKKQTKKAQNNLKILYSRYLKN